MLTPDDASLRAAILSRVPGDGTPIGNLALSKAVAEHFGAEFDMATFEAARQALVAEGALLKGSGRGGSLRRATPTPASAPQDRAHQLRGGHVSLHVHERIDPASILAAVRKQLNDTKAGKAPPVAAQMGLFSAPFEDVPLRDAIDFYKHERGWSNRLVAGDSLLVMNSLLQKEGMAGRVQMIYIDPPYGIKYGSNFQPFVGKRDVKDRSDADLTQEPEMIKAFRDTWELGLHHPTPKQQKSKTDRTDSDTGDHHFSGSLAYEATAR